MGALTHREQLSSHPLIGSPRFITIHLGNRLLSCPACCKFAVSSVIHTTLRRDEASKLRHHRVLQGSPFSWCDAHGFWVGCGGQETSPKGRAQSFSRARFWIQALNWEILRAWHSRRWVLLGGTWQRGKGYLLNGYNLQNLPHTSATCVVQRPYTHKSPRALVSRLAAAILRF